ncbi:putative lysine biosynthesis protein [Streptomyces scabiei 87.22]|uniref:Putative lysine biosynthesis protein n=1 Tax=Streptomyces scabiei (strain 87.22) TaxID=680198 RepID=C9ZAR0_STRSW|nr:dihydrodipicolinate synthase family protein [Streptomyces scabiei]MDX2575792.1 dihydrodipicolinate synthase family protein [Streptomyces scabiei]MDX2652045.1 dihydrodipicolinate synthase family protein [Streptomyces scabiei]MDX2719571.1 dihydrodipicolinate synthase family protein [Streptomyces scabiei]MDX2864048.1 dihydrodipicolinate synthase family protein [Streptomyces scabiei]MDX2881972.1 dihydrodipicolinate synthase family protein [Streptomyces scabiei]
MPVPAPLTGVVPPVCTPLTPDREVDVPSLTRLVDHLVAAGVDALFVLGSSSEAAFLTDAQRRRVVETVVGHVGGGLPVLAGAIDMTTPRVLDHVRAVTAAGAQAVVATAPFYTRTHPAEIARHFRLLAAGSPVPVLAYDIPSAVHTKLPADVVLELAAEGVIAGLKDSSGDLAAFRTVVTGARTDPAISGFSVLTGSELVVDSALALGADGAVPGLANVDPAGYVRLDRLFRAGDRDGARAEQERLCALFGLTGVGSSARMGGGSSALGAFKAALHLRGVIACPATAEPQVPLSEAEVERVGAYLAAAELL